MVSFRKPSDCYTGNRSHEHWHTDTDLTLSSCVCVVAGAVSREVLGIPRIPGFPGNRAVLPSKNHPCDTRTPSKELSPTGRIDSAPKDFAVYVSWYFKVFFSAQQWQSNSFEIPRLSCVLRVCRMRLKMGSCSGRSCMTRMESPSRPSSLRWVQIDRLLSIMVVHIFLYLIFTLHFFYIKKAIKEFNLK